jgi:hypothetical protein
MFAHVIVFVTGVCCTGDIVVAVSLLTYALAGRTVVADCTPKTVRTRIGVIVLVDAVIVHAGIVCAGVIVITLSVLGTLRSLIFTVFIAKPTAWCCPVAFPVSGATIIRFTDLG